jgi:hypothetical protein
VQLNPEIIRRQIENLKLAYPTLVDDDHAWQMSLESETNINELLTTIVRRIEDTRALSSGTSERLQELAARKLRFEHRIVALRELAFKLMSAAELAKLELPEATLSLRAGTQQLVGEADPNTLPDALCNISRAPNRTAIKDTLKSGQDVPGFVLSNSSPSLTIRIK